MSEPRRSKADLAIGHDLKCEVISTVCDELAAQNIASASAILEDRYPFVPFQNTGRSYALVQRLRLFIRDRFVDRYSGRHLIFPGTLRIISLRLPKVFPFHQHGKTDQCHFAFWELFPTLDHVLPVSRGGKDDASNWVTTSMTRNAAKANFTLEELDWPLLVSDDTNSWDGQMSWFMSEVHKDRALLKNAYVKSWWTAANRVEKELEKT